MEEQKSEPAPEIIEKRNIIALEQKYQRPKKLREICKEFRDGSEGLDEV